MSSHWFFWESYSKQKIPLTGDYTMMFWLFVSSWIVKLPTLVILIFISPANNLDIWIKLRSFYVCNSRNALWISSKVECAKKWKTSLFRLYPNFFCSLCCYMYYYWLIILVWRSIRFQASKTPGFIVGLAKSSTVCSRQSFGYF